MRRLLIVFIGLAVIVPSSAFAAAPVSGTHIIFAWNGTLFSHSVQSGEVVLLGPAGTDAATMVPGYDIYALAGAPLTDALDAGYGFHHGVWSPDRTQFAYVEMNPPQYRVRVQAVDGENSVLITGQADSARGYLDPIGWTADGDIVLLERRLLNFLPVVHVWHLDPAAGTLESRFVAAGDRLSGRSAVLPDGASVFLGFDLAHEIGVLYDIGSEQARTFASQLGQMLPPAKGFDYHPLQVVGALSTNTLATFADQIQARRAASSSASQPAPFLHWPLPDDARSITCYPDSAWTTANFDVTCPGMSSPRQYVGHQGTDIGGKPDGLPIGTPVYPAAPGVVVATYRDCLGQNPSCNNSYGNTVTVEHVLIVNGETQVWYTGYGHLQTVLVDDYAYVTAFDEPLALSGSTGTGGAHLHFEVRTASQWVDPWDNRAGDGLWLGSNARPLAAVNEVDADAVPVVLAVCTSYTGNNIRSGPGTEYDAVGKTVQDTTYHVLEVTFVDEGAARGDWYHVQFEGGDGWLWAGLLTCP